MSTNSLSYLFGTSSAQSSSFSLYSSLGDLSSIRSGSYQKLMKSYYAEQKKTSSSSSTSTTRKDVDTTEKKELLEAKSSADTLVEESFNMNATGTKSLFNKKEITTKDEKTGQNVTKLDYDREGIYKAVKSFVDSYNNTLSAASEVDTTSVLQKTLFMTNQTAAYKNSFTKVGITIGTDNKLSVDEAKIKKADISELKTLFTGFNSFASKTAQKASAISSASTLASGTKTYTKTGSYDLSSLYNRINTSI